MKKITSLLFLGSSNANFSGDAGINQAIAVWPVLTISDDKIASGLLQFSRYSMLSACSSSEGQNLMANGQWPFTSTESEVKYAE